MTDGNKTDGMRGKHHEEIAIDRPFVEVSSRVPGAIERAGLILLADVDWSRFKGKTVITPASPGQNNKDSGLLPGKDGGLLPGQNRLDPTSTAATSVRSFLICDQECVNKVLEEPENALWSHAIVLCERNGKTCLLYVNPTTKLEEMKEHGKISDDKYSKCADEAKLFEKKLDEVVNTLKGGRSS